VNITFVIPYFYPAWQYGGQPRSAFELARGLVRRGHRVQVLTTDSGGSTRLKDIGRNESREVDGIQVHYYSNVSNALAYRHRIFWPSELFRQIRERISATDMVHIHELRATTSVSAYRAARRTGKPYVLSTHGGLKHLGKAAAKTVFDELWGKRILADAGALMAVSPVEEHDAKAFGVELAHIRRLPNAVNLEDFQNLPPRESFRARWKLGRGRILLFLGRLHWIKGADLLIEAFHTAHAAESDLRLVIAGPDDGQEAELRKQVERLRLTGVVTFAGFLDESAKREALTGCDALVIPSRAEVFALSALEGLACGTPVIMSSVCGLHPLPTPEQGVLTFEIENPGDLARKLLIMAGPEPFRHNLTAGREFVLQEFSPDVIAATAETIYAEVKKTHG